jgi:predicted AAA+ superfamily ATPase
MIFSRKIEGALYEWKAKKNRKPLILRGARQVGKSTLIKKMGEQKEVYALCMNIWK